MEGKRMSVSTWSRWCLLVTFMLAAVVGNAWGGDPIRVWVQPSGDTFANAYALQGEGRDYFGRAECDNCGALEYKWDFSDTTTTGFLPVGDPRYIAYAGKTFATFGSQWARLTVRDSSDTGNSATVQINLQVIASASDNLNRKKNSAIDRGLRRLYLSEVDAGSGGSYFGNWSGGHTGMALIAFENHGHNLQAPDSDIYKTSVVRGIQYLLNTSSKPDIDVQRCIGNPDTNGNGKGVIVGPSDTIYHPSIALLALVNSADKTYAQTHFAATGNDLNGMSLYDIAVDATDWLAWAQSDGGSSIQQAYCDASAYGGGYFYIPYNASAIVDSWTTYGYVYFTDLATVGGCSGNFNFDWGDGSSTSYAPDSTYCPDPYNGDPNRGYLGLNYWTYTPGPISHTYGTGGDKVVTLSYNGTALCSAIVPIVGPQTGACTAADSPNGAGGWSYSPNEARGDNSLTQWATLGLSEAKNRWGIDTNPAVITMLGNWLAWSQCSNGTFGYDYPESWCNYQKVGAGLIMLKYVGKPLADAAVQNALSYAQTNWLTYGGDYNFDNLYSMYGMYKAMKVWGMTDLGPTPGTGQNWEQQYDQNLIDRQNGDGSWDNLGGWMEPSTAAAVAILAPEVASLPPVANAGGPYPTINGGQVLGLNGANSYHQDPAKSIVGYQWDFDASDGLWWNTKATPAPGEGAVSIGPSVSYPILGADKSYTVTLRVVDNTSPTPLYGSNTAVVNVHSGNVPPVAKTNGPWTALPGVAITFDGSASFDANSCTTAGNPSCLADSIVMYEWDLDGDGIYGGPGDGTCVPGTNCRKVQKAYANPGSLPIRLRVTDSFGLTGVSSDSVNIVSVALVYGQVYQTCWRTAVDRFTDRIGLQVTFKNQGTAEAEDVVMTLTGVPTNLTVMSGSASLGNMGPGVSKATACDPLNKTADIKLRVDKRIVPTGNWTWRGYFELNGSPYTVDNLPPIGP